MTDDNLTLLGTAIRGDRVRATAELNHGLTLSLGEVYLRNLRDQPLGIARLTLNETDDVLVEATVPASQLDHLLNTPYLCVAAQVNEIETETAEVAFVLVCESTTDSRQLPYRFTDVPEAHEATLRRAGYRPRRVIDERHEVEVTFNVDEGRWDAMYDETKSHVEWYHVAELDHVNVQNAIARALAYDSWTELTELGDTDAELGERVFAEISGLGLRGRHH